MQAWVAREAAKYGWSLADFDEAMALRYLDYLETLVGTEDEKVNWRPWWRDEELPWVG